MEFCDQSEAEPEPEPESAFQLLSLPSSSSRWLPLGGNFVVVEKGSVGKGATSLCCTVALGWCRVAETLEQPSVPRTEVTVLRKI